MGNAAYAYLVANHVIVSYVWLFNRHPAPLSSPWETPDQEFRQPVMNSARYANRDESDCLIRPDEYTVLTRADTKCGPSASVYIRGILRAILCLESTPGWSKLAKVDSPVALTFEEQARE